MGGGGGGRVGGSGGCEPRLEAIRKLKKVGGGRIGGLVDVNHEL